MYANDIIKNTIVKLGNLVVKTDEDKELGLESYCYTHCDNDSSENLKNCRGLIFHNDKLVIKTFPYVDEYVVDGKNNEKLDSYLQNKNDISCFDAYEGTLLKVFYHKKWFLSTYRKLNAFRSRWASRQTFGEQFVRALTVQYNENESFRDFFLKGDESKDLLDRFYESLDINKQYTFLILTTTENRIGCRYDKPMIYHVGTFSETKRVDSDLKLPKPKKRTFKNREDLYEYVRNLNPDELQGVLFFGDYNFKLLNSEYYERTKIRGNESSVKFRYLQVRMDEKLAERLYNLYPEHSQDFEDYECYIREVATQIYDEYRKRYIFRFYEDGQLPRMPQDDYRVMRTCHNHYLQDRIAHLRIFHKYYLRYL